MRKLGDRTNITKSKHAYARLKSELTVLSRTANNKVKPM